MRSQEQKIDTAPLIRSNATITGQFDLHREVAVATWSIGRNQVSYEKPDSHTLSLYLKGGETSCRADQLGNWGHAGTLCLMPQGHASNWHIGGEIDFAHLYFSDHILKQYASERLERDVRMIDLKDLTYQDDDTLQKLLTGYLSHCHSMPEGIDMLGEQLLYEIFEHLIRTYNGYDSKVTPIKGGLSPQRIRLVKAMIGDHLGDPLSIQGLAALIGLSPYHFARQFKESFGDAPAQYIGRQRLQAVKHLLESDMPLAVIAVKTGFSQQSHMTAQFKRHTGFTPNQYRKLLKH